MSLRSVKKLIESCKYKFIDLRNPCEITIGMNTIKNSINIPMNDFLYKLDKLEEETGINKNDNVILYCKSGMRSRRAAFFMKNAGYKNVYEIKGGIKSLHNINK